MEMSKRCGYALRVPKSFDKVQTLSNCANLIWQTTNSAEDILTSVQYHKLEYARALIEEVEQQLIRDVLLLQCDIEFSGEGSKKLKVLCGLEEIPITTNES